MRQKFSALLLTFIVLLSATSPGCSMLFPGDVGWFCETDDDCTEGRTCETYKYEDSDHENKLCTGDKYLDSSSQNYGWILLIAAWIMGVIGPIALVLLIIVAKIKQARGEKKEA